MSMQLKVGVARTRTIEPSDALCPKHLWHESFDGPEAETTYHPAFVPPAIVAPCRNFSDDVSKNLLRRMHYAAHRSCQRVSFAERDRWINAYVRFRNVAIEGNMSVVASGLWKYSLASRRRFELEQECNFALLSLVTKFDPWRPNQFRGWLIQRLKWNCRTVVWNGGEKHLSDLAQIDEMPLPDLREREDLDMDKITALHNAIENDLSVKQRVVLKKLFGLDGHICDAEAQVARELGESGGTIHARKRAGVQRLHALLADWDY